MKPLRLARVEDEALRELQDFLNDLARRSIHNAAMDRKRAAEWRRRAGRHARLAEQLMEVRNGAALVSLDHH